MCEDTEAEVKDKNEEVNVDQKDAEVSKDDNEEEKEVKDSKEEGEDERKEEAKSDAMEVDDVGNTNEQHDDKTAEIADLEEAGSRKRAAKKSGGEKGKTKTETEEKKKNDEPKTPVGPTIDRPVRERKSVERLVAVIEQDTAKEFHIEKGCGTALKDIPNVAYKLSKKKVVDDTLKQLHTVLYVRRGKALEIKSNILRFSGFVWHENEEKQKTKVHEKLDKLNKDKLFEFCDLLDIPVTKTTAKKEDVITKLIEFLLVPHATTSELLAEKEQSSKGNKRKRANKKSASTSEATPSKGSAKKSKSASEEQKGTPETEDSEEEQEDENNEHQNTNGGPAKSESEEHASEPESEEEDSKKHKRDTKNPPSKTESASKTKPKKEATPKKSNPQKKTPTESSTVQSKSKDQSESQPPTKTFSRKKKNNVVDEKTLTSKKSASKEKTEVKKAAKEKETPKEEKLKPSDDELKTATCEILKVVDFNTATFTNILKLLNDRFNTELTPRKATLKSIIKEELTKLADEEDDETEAEKTGKETSAQKA
ncbi:hypothetical protein L1987_08015 [Smallanthus sonchifolius]|uniref:Uncharacterized protein n=1 Tax=Smallanthus sonchifolius TaxID=185202 RepID=A0ACB9JMI2_9ASTR|nr:hypothetical protein L1987_08015 [Smallanthus sonchifolius]